MIPDDQVYPLKDVKARAVQDKALRRTNSSCVRSYRAWKSQKALTDTRRLTQYLSLQCLRRKISRLDRKRGRSTSVMKTRWISVWSRRALTTGLTLKYIATTSSPPARTASTPKKVKLSSPLAGLVSKQLPPPPIKLAATFQMTTLRMVHVGLAPSGRKRVTLRRWVQMNRLWSRLEDNQERRPHPLA